MKRIVLLVPDVIHHTLGGSSANYRLSEIPLNGENLLKVLSKREDYHEDFFFAPAGQIRILTIEDVDEPVR
ncbi:MAG: hypothetical protein JXQ27_04710 [Acidobacteria bacterium]|nr:hypothetical protein [Acidobacteriota bacterium]